MLIVINNFPIPSCLLSSFRYLEKEKLISFISTLHVEKMSQKTYKPNITLEIYTHNLHRLQKCESRAAQGCT